MRTQSTLSIPLILLGLALALAPPALAADEFPLDAFERKSNSQFGEDGVIERIFEIIEPTNHYAVEFGAYDGVTNSNTRELITKRGWSSFQIEGHPGRAAKLAKLYAKNPKVKTKHAWIWPGNIEILFEDAGVPKDLDFLVIDIDSNDYYVWRAIQSFRPKVVMIECNHSFPPPELAVIKYHPFNYWDQTNYVGASLQSMVNLGKKKGYELVHVMRTGPNIFFVDEKYYDRFGIEDNSTEKMWRGAHRILGDEKSYPPDKRTLKVDAFEIPKVWVER
jgi:hypothetical protein